MSDCWIGVFLFISCFVFNLSRWDVGGFCLFGCFDGGALSRGLGELVGGGLRSGIYGRSGYLICGRGRCRGGRSCGFSRIGGLCGSWGLSWGVFDVFFGWMNVVCRGVSVVINFVCGV